MRALKMWMSALLPIFLLIILLFSFMKFGPLGVFEANFPPIEDVVVQRIVVEPETFILEVINNGPEPVTISQLAINERFWQFAMKPDNTLLPLQKGKIKMIYPWVEGEPYEFTLVASDGVTFDAGIDVTTITPTFNSTYLKTFVLLGLYVGVIPVLLGLLWFPFLRRLKGQWFHFLLAFTIGLLLFLGFDTIEESFELIEMVPSAFNGFGLFVIGFFLAILILSSVSYKTEHAKKTEYKALVWGYLIALGIGLHNLGEGLAIGSAYAVGEIALGSALVIGFMVHNVTEGIAIVSPLTRAYTKVQHFIVHLILMGIIAGAPTILGTIIGGFSFSPAFAVFFLAVGAGAIFDVCFDILHHMSKGQWLSLFTATNGMGFLLGLLVMYLTGFLILG